MITVEQATVQLVDAAETLAAWYRSGGNRETPLYSLLMSGLADAVAVRRAAVEREAKFERVLAEGQDRYRGALDRLADM